MNIKDERVKELREWLRAKDAVLWDINDDLEAILDEHAALKAENERLEKKASDTLAIQVRAEARAEKAEADLRQLTINHANAVAEVKELEAEVEQIRGQLRECGELRRIAEAELALAKPLLEEIALAVLWPKNEMNPLQLTFYPDDATNILRAALAFREKKGEKK